MKILNVAVLGFAFSLVGCGGGDDGSGGPNACDYIVGQSYDSIEEQECGVGRTCQWRITFYDTGLYDWTHDGTVSPGEYSCDGLSIDRSGGGGGKYDPNTGIVTWGDVAYQ